MADMISIILIIIFGFITAKKIIIPRIVAKKAAKNGVVISSQPIPDGMQETIAKNNRPLTGFGVDLINLSLFDGETDTEALKTRIRQTASEMLLNASMTGRDVRLNMTYAHPVLILHVTYTV